jgi:hypothetical protein
MCVLVCYNTEHVVQRDMMTNSDWKINWELCQTRRKGLDRHAYVLNRL